MAIYDNNGTTNTEIWKIYDNNGTTSFQIGKVYDNDGTANYLVYNAEENLFPEQYNQWEIGGNQNGNGRSEYTINSSTIHLLSDLGYENGSYSNATKAWAYTPLIDFSQYKKLTITFSYLITGTNYGTQATAKIGILNSTQVVVYSNNGCAEQGANNWSWEQSFVTNGSSAEGTKTYDISNINTTSRLWLLVYSYNTYAVMNVTSIILS